MISQFPFLRLTIPFIFGILVAPEPSYPVTLLFFCCAFTLLYVELQQPSFKWKNRKFICFLFHFLFFLLGLNATAFQQKNIQENPGNKSCLVYLNKADHDGKSYIRFTSRIYFLNDSSVVGSANAFTFISTRIKNLSMGDVLLILKNPSKIKKVYTPGGFDFHKFANQHNIHYNLFINNESEIIKIKSQKTIFLETIYRIRRWIISTMQRHLKHATDAGLTEALLIGYKQDLDKALQTQYTATGVSHIIAVSGMHLGLIFYVLTNFIGLWFKNKTARHLGLFLILPLLWCFAMISGASASVLRSVLVFTIMLLGKAFSRKAGNINALMASAFFMLVFNPKLISDIGFQLSYAAVLSILIYEPIFSKCVHTKNKLLVYLWSMISITLAAQILTTPLVLYHFKQFPVLFLFTNLVAVPLSSLVLLQAICLCLLSLFNFPVELVSKTIHFCLSGMNNYITKIASIPFNTIHIDSSILTTLSLYLLISCITLKLLHDQKHITILILLTLLLFSVSYTYNKQQLHRKNEIMVLYIKNETFVLHRHGKTGKILTSTDFFEDKVRFKQVLLALGNELGIENWEYTLLNKKPLVLELYNDQKEGQILIFSALGNQSPSIQQFINQWPKTTTVIADGSNTLWKIRQWEKEGQELHLRLHSIQEKGTFVMPCQHK